jgi:nitric oxide reductase subunit C
MRDTPQLDAKAGTIKAIGARHVMTVFCVAFAIYSAFIYTSGTEIPRSSGLTQQAKHGMALFQEKNCIACHQFYGLGGYMGPDLTNVISSPNKGADYARSFIENGTDKMPNYELSASEINDLVEFLKFVDVSGVYPPKNPKIRWDGTVAYDGG